MIRKIVVKYLNSQLSPRYGSLRGFISITRYQLLYYLGVYRDVKKIEWDKVERLVFVCKGNICRSPFAEIVAHSMRLETISCGIETDDGMPANEMAISTASNKGYNLGQHKTTKLTSLEIKNGDLFIAMEPYHLKYLKTSCKTKDVCTLMGLWGDSVMPYIHDPYNSNALYFSNCFDFIIKAVKNIEIKMNSSRL